MIFEIVTLENINEEILLDVREANEYAGGFFSNAINMPLSKLKITTDVAQDYDKDQTYVLYCIRGMRARNAAELLRSAGFENILLLDRGYT